MSSFDVILPSNSSVEGNKTNSFTVRLPHALSFGSLWECALTSLTYPRTWSTLSTFETQYVQINWQNGDKNRYNLPKAVFKKPSDVSSLLTTLFENIANEAKVAYDAKVANEKLLKSEIQWLNIKKNVDKLVQIIYDETNQIFKWSVEHQFINAIKLSPQVEYIMGFKNELIYNSFKSTYSCDLTGGFSTIQIIAPGLINPVIIGNTSAPVLRLVGVRGKHGEIVEETFLNPQYRTLMSKNICEIHIELRSLEGSLIPFEWGSCVITLNFRKRTLL